MEINKGSYSAVKFGNGTNEALKAFNAEHSIPNALDPNKLHTTVLFSRKFLPNYVPAGRIDPPLVGKFIGYDVWLSAPFSGTRCLVMLYDCPELVKRHKDLMTEHGATYDFEEYKPHITISYDIHLLLSKQSLLVR